MTSDLDIYRTANVLVKHYGEDAMLEKSSVDGQRVPEASQEENVSGDKTSLVVTFSTGFSRCYHLD